jgi:hypothetical protein
MKVLIVSSGEDLTDDKAVKYKIQLENDSFKGTITTYDNSDFFINFAKDLLKFPFDTSKPVQLSSYNMELTITLDDPVGRIKMQVEMKDDYSNSINFSDTSLNVNDIHQFSERILSTDFSSKQKLEWQFKP